MKLVDILEKSTDYLRSKNIENPRLNSELMLSSILGCKRLDLYLEFDKPLKENEVSLMRSYVSKRSRNEPLQYILKKCAFYNIEIDVNKNVLIPRPETEILVENVIEHIKESKRSAKFKILDIGTGSGAIAIALKKNIEDAYVFATDKSKEALDVAIRNAEKMGLNINFIEGPFLEPVKDMEFDVIASNPPYIKKDDIKKLPDEIKYFEPFDALNGGENGIDFYTTFFDSIDGQIKKDGAVFFEIGKGQKNAIVNFAFKKGFQLINAFKDLNNIERVLKFQIK